MTSRGAAAADLVSPSTPLPLGKASSGTAVVSTAGRLASLSTSNFTRTQPLRYGARILLYRQSLDSFVVATSSAEAPVGLQRDDPTADGDRRLNYEQAIFVVAPGDPVDANSSNRGQGDLVKYGQTIRLIHQTHQQPLCHHVEQHAVGLKGNLRVLLGGGKGGSSVLGKTRNMRWRVMPRYRLRVEGEAVADGDPVLLQSALDGRYLNSAEQYDEVSDGCFLEVSCGSAVQGFQMTVFDPDVGNRFKPSVLRCGDCITLLHTEEHKYLTADMERAVCYLRSPESKLAELGDEAELAPSLTTSLLTGDDAAGHGSSSSAAALRNGPDTEEVSYLSTFFIEGADPRQGGVVRTGGQERYRLKCLSTGLYLRTGCTEANPEDLEYDEAALLGNGGAPLNDAKSIVSGLSSLSGGPAGSAFSLPQNTFYELSLTANPQEPGTTFRLRLASSSSTEYIQDGNRVFLEAADTPAGSLWLFAGGRLDDDDAAGEITVASLAQRATTQGSVALYARGTKSMRDGVELRRLPTKSARELHMIRGLLPPLERYAEHMLEGIGDPFRVREVRENMNQLRQLCYQRSGMTAAQKAGGLQGLVKVGMPAMGSDGSGGAGDGGAEQGFDMNTAGEGDDEGEEAFMSARSRAEGYVNPSWQSKLFQQGVPSLVLRVAEATMRCPYVRPSMLYTADIVQTGEDYEDERASSPSHQMPSAGRDDVEAHGGDTSAFPTGGGEGGGGPGGEDEGQPARKRRRFVPMRYSDLGDVVDTCFDFVSLLVSDRPKYAASLHAHVDFIVEYCPYVPSALRCLAVLFQNNPVYVELPMAQKRLEGFLQLLAKRGRDPDVLKVIRLFAQCGEESMVEAQRVILRFFCKQENAERLLCPIKLMPPPDHVVIAPATEDSATPNDAKAGSPKPRRENKKADTSFTASTAGNPLAAGTPQNVSSSADVIQKPASPTTSAAADKAATALPLSTQADSGHVAMVGLPHSIFADEQSGDSMSIATSTQYRGKGSALGELLLTASNAEDVRGLTYFPVEGLHAVLQDWSEVKDVFIPYYTEQLLLFSALASGRNQNACQELVFVWVPREVLVLMLRSRALPTSLHAAFLSLFACTVVDVTGSLNIKQEIRNIRCVITGSPDTDKPAVSSYSLHAARTDHAVGMAKEQVIAYMARVAVSGDEETAQEYLCTLQLTETLVNGGAWELPEYTGLIAQLVNTLDPRSDDRTTHLESPAVQQIKVRALRLLNLIMDIILTRKALELVDHFRNEEDAPPATQLFQYTFNAFLQRHKVATGAPPVEQPELPAEGICHLEKAPSSSSSDPSPTSQGSPLLPAGTSGEDREDAATAREQQMRLVARLCEALMQLGYATDSIRVRRHCIFLFLRMTNYLEELYYVANRVQLLSSEASIGFYSDINKTSASLEFLLRKSFRRSNTHVLAHAALDALDHFLSVVDYGAAIEKLAMMRHVGIPQQLLAMLQRLPLPIRDSGHRIIFKVVSLLQTMSQDPLIHAELRREVEALAPLATQDPNVLSLLRTLYVQGASEQCIVPFGVIEGITRCLYQAQSACAAIEVLADLLRITTSAGHPITQHQQLVWRGLVSDPKAVRQVQFRYTWCGEKGRTIRERVLMSRDYYVSTGRLARHLGLCELIHLISVDNELVKPEEIRHEVFGLNSIDAILEVTTDARLPVFFRKPYVALTETLILDDPAALSAVFAHRSFGEYLRLCTMDCARYLQLFGGSNFFPEIDEDLERREDAAMRCAPVNTFERSVDDARFDVAVYEALVFGPICGCLARVCEGYRNGVERLSNRLRSQMKLCINEMVDLVCDLVKLAMQPPAVSSTGTESSPRRPSAGGEAVRRGSTTDNGTRWSPLQNTRMYTAMTAAKTSGFHGTGRWRGQAFEELFEAFERRTKVGGGGNSEAHSPTTAIAAAFGEGKGAGSLLDGGDERASTGSGTSAGLLTAAKIDKVGAKASAVAVSSDRVAVEVDKGPSVDSKGKGSRPSGAGKRPHHISSSTTEEEEGEERDGAATKGTEQALTSLWVDFLKANVLESQYLAPNNVYLTAAGILLRTGDRGSSFLRVLFASLMSMSGPNTIRLLRLTRQTVRLAPNNRLDDSVLLPFEDVQTETPCLTLELSRTARQSLLARWPGDLAVETPVPLVSLVTELAGTDYPGVRLAVLETATALLKGGHRGMQESYNAYCKRITNERLFFVLRNHLSRFREALQRFHQGITRDSTPDEAAHFLSDMPLVTLELHLVQLLCANQFTPLQSYLAAQPDNDVSVNLIESLVDLLSMSPKVANEVTTPFFLQLLRTISETLQGPCRTNQDTFVAYKAADYLTLLLSNRSIIIRPKGGLTTFEEVFPYDKEKKRNADKAKKALKEAVRERDAEARRTLHHAGVGAGGGTASAATTAALVESRRRNMSKKARAKEEKRGETDYWPTVEEVRRHCMTRIHTASLSTLLALIEGRQEPAFVAQVLSTVDMAVLGQSMDKSVRVYEAIYGSVVRIHPRGILSGDVSNSVSAMVRYLREFFRGSRPTDSEELEDELALAVSIFIFFRACYDMQQLAITRSLRSGDGQARYVSQSFSEFVDKRGRSIRQVLRKTESYRRLGYRVGKVEIIRDGSLERVYFRILTSSEDNLNRSTRDRIIRNAVRTSDNERIQSFFSQSTSTIVEINTLAAMRRNIAVFLINYCSGELSFLALVLILAMNLTMVIGIRAPTSPYEPGTDPGIRRALNGLGIAIICVQGTLLLQALTGPARVKIATNYENWRARREERLAQLARHDMAADRSELLQADEQSKPKLLNKVFLTVSSVVTDTDVLEHAFFLFVCIMGYVQHQIWYSVQLLQIMFNSPVLQNLITALSRNIMSLVLTLVLLVFVIFVFTNISFYFFSELMDPFGIRGNGFNCYTLSQCLVVHIDNMRNGGGIGDTVDWPVYYAKDGKGYWFTFFRLAYYLVICLILSNLFLGVIVDSLAQLRQSNDFIVVDQEKKCFICGVERNVFDVVQPGTYDTHIEEEHNMWHYIYFLHYLSAKDESNLTGQEAYVSRLMRLRDVTFFPIGRSIVLASLSGEGGDSSGEGSGSSSSGGGAATNAVSAAAAASAAVTAMTSTTNDAIAAAVEPLKGQMEATQDMIAKLAKALGTALSPTSPALADAPSSGSAASGDAQTSPPAVTFEDPNGGDMQPRRRP